MDITKKNLLVKVTVHKYDFKVRDKESMVEISNNHGVDPTLLDFKKNTMLKDDVGDICKTMRKFRPVVVYLTTPWLDGGWRLLSVDLYEQLEDKLRELNSELSEVKEILRMNWDTYVKNSKSKLNGRWDERDYPSADYVVSKFGVDVHYGNVPESGDLRVDMAKDTMDNIKAQMDSNYDNNIQIAMVEIWDRTVTAITHMKDRLTHYSKEIKEEKSPRMFSSMLNNVKDLVQLLPAMNLTNDPKLEQVRQQLETDFSRLSIDLLKEDDATREKTIEKTKIILDKLDGFVL